MRTLVMLVFACVILGSTDARAQEALAITTPPGKSMVWNPEFTVPSHDPEKEIVAFRLLPFSADEADMPFFVDLEGIVVSQAGAEEAVSELSEGARFAVLLCRFPQSDSFNLALPSVRSQYCTLRHVERQP